MTIELEAYPIDGRSWISAPFGQVRPTHVHDGIDLGAREGTPLVAPITGRVVAALDNARRSCGFGLVIDSADRRYRITMCHFQAMPLFERGETVHAGDVVGHVGQTGNATGPHLHMRINDLQTGAVVDPTPALAHIVGPGEDDSHRHESRSPRARSSSGAGGVALALLGLVLLSKR